MICWTCHRTLKNAPVMIGGHPFGPKCAKAAKEIPAVERDLFGFDIERACEAATERLRVSVQNATNEASYAIRVSFYQARARLFGITP